MAPDTLVGTYTRYKRGTSKLLQWLYESAAVISPPTATSSKKAGKKPVQPPQPASIKKVPVDTLIPLAQRIISSTDPIIPITEEIRNIAKDTINGRKACARWYGDFTATRKGKQLKGDVIESNRRHAHFVEVLEQVYELLRIEAKKRRPKRKKKEPEMAADTGDLGNMFKYLELEDLVSDDDDQKVPTGKSGTSTKTPRPQEKGGEQEYELEGGEDEDMMLAVYCLFDDVAEVRKQLKQTWEDYKDGKISFLSVCQLSQDAMRIAGALVDELERQHPDLKGFENVMEALGKGHYIAYAQSISSETAELCSDRSQAGFPPQKDSRHDDWFLHMPAWAALEDVTKLVDHLCDGHEEMHHTVSTHPGHGFSRALLKTVPDILDCLGHPPTRAEEGGKYSALGDYYTRLLVELMCARHVNLSTELVVGTSIYQDVYDYLGGDLQRGVREFSPILTESEEIVKAFSAWFNDQESGAVCQFANPAVLIHFIEMLCPEQTQGCRQGWILKIGKREGSYDAFLVPLRILEHFPMHAAHLTWLALLVRQDLGVDIANSSSSLLPAAHLHHAAEKQSQTSFSWPDLEFALSREKKINPLLRLGDGTVRSAAKQYSMALGLTLTRVAHTHRPRLPNWRLCDEHSAKLKTVSYLFDTDSPSKEATKNAFIASLVAEIDLRSYYQGIKRFHLRGPGIANEIIATQWEATNKLCPAQVLVVLQEMAIENEPYLHFDYLGLTRQCFNLVASALTSAIIGSKNRVARRRSTSMWMYEVVHDILWDAAGLETRGIDPSSSELAIAGRALAARLSTGEGDRGVKMVNETLGHRHLASAQPRATYGFQALSSVVKEY